MSDSGIELSPCVFLLFPDWKPLKITAVFPMRFKEHSDVIIATAFLQVCTAYMIFLQKKPTYSTEIKYFCYSLKGINYHVIGAYRCGQLKKMGQSTSMLLGTNSSTRIERGTI